MLVVRLLMIWLPVIMILGCFCHSMLVSSGVFFDFCWLLLVAAGWLLWKLPCPSVANLWGWVMTVMIRFTIVKHGEAPASAMCGGWDHPRNWGNATVRCVLQEIQFQNSPNTTHVVHCRVFQCIFSFNYPLVALRWDDNGGHKHGNTVATIPASLNASPYLWGRTDSSLSIDSGRLLVKLHGIWHVSMHGVPPKDFYVFPLLQVKILAEGWASIPWP